MKKQYPIVHNEEQLGIAEMKREGMFWRIQCYCESALDKDVHVMVSAGQKTLDLGICVPYKNGSELKTRVPMRLLNDEKLVFRLAYVIGERFIPLRADRPLSVLAQLPNCRFGVKDGVRGIYVLAQKEISNPTGQ